MRNLRNQKLNMQRQSDIYRKLQLEISDQMIDLQNMEEEYGDINMKK